MKTKNVVKKMLALFVKLSKPPTIGARAKQLLRDGLAYDVVLGILRAEYPKAKTTADCVYWYASRLRRAA